MEINDLCTMNMDSNVVYVVVNTYSKTIKIKSDNGEEIIITQNFVDLEERENRKTKVKAVKQQDVATYYE